MFDEERIFYTIGPAWSLTLEITFYLALALLGPLAIASCRRLRSRESRIMLLATGSLAFGTASVLWETVARFVWHIPETNWPYYFGPQARMAPFALGVLLAVLRVAVRERSILPGWGAVALRLFALALLRWVTWQATLDREWAKRYYHDISAVGWVFLVASTVLAVQGQRWQRALSWRPLTWAGLISYSVYIWHDPVLRGLATADVIGHPGALFAVDCVLVLIATVAVATASYWVIEYPTSQLNVLVDDRKKKGPGYRVYDVSVEQHVQPALDEAPESVRSAP